MNDKQIDVLAYHDDLLASHKALSAYAYYAKELPKAEAARAAVAELIEAATELRQRQRDYLAGPKSERSEAKGRLVGIAAERVDAALARCGGAA